MEILLEQRSQSHIRPIHVLLVENESADIKLAKTAFAASKLPVTLFAVSDGEQALDLLNKKPGYESAPRPDLVLLDLKMPKVNGRQFLAAAKGDPSLRRIPIVVLSTSGNEEDIVAAYDLHANSFIAKPVALDSFIATIKTLIEYWSATAVLPSPRRRPM